MQPGGGITPGIACSPQRSRQGVLIAGHGGTFLAICRRAVRHTCSILLLATGLAVGSVEAQVIIEGTVTLPKPSYDRGLNQRYNATSDVALAPTNPPAAVVYLEGDFRS